MKELYQSYIRKFEKAREIAVRYERPIDKIDGSIEEIKSFKVTVPLTGGFSTGKSSLINCLLEEELLTTDITPETAMPAEICYGSDKVVCRSDNGEKTISVQDYREGKLPASVKLVELALNKPFLSTIPSVKLVDMPGFDSGNRVHDQAISDYLPHSLAYIIAVSAEEGAIRDSVLAFLSELKLNQVPVYIVITKADKILPDELDDVKEQVKKNVQDRLELTNVPTVITSADDEDIEPFRTLLTDIEKQSDSIFEKRYQAILTDVLNDLAGYLEKRLKNVDSSEEELEQQIQELQNNVEQLQIKRQEEQRKFEQQCEKAIESTHAHVIAALHGSSSMLENMLYQGQDISSKLNMIVRMSITEEINRSFQPKVRKYVSDMSEMISSCISSADTSPALISSGQMESNAQTNETIKNLITPVSTIVTTMLTGSTTVASIAATLGISSAVLGPVGVIVGLLIGAALTKSVKNREEAQKRAAAREKVQEVISRIDGSISTSIRESVDSIRERIDELIEQELKEKIENQTKALNDTKKKLTLNREEKKKLTDTLMQDLEAVKNIWQGC